MPPAFILSQDQTLHSKNIPRPKAQTVFVQESLFRGRAAKRSPETGSSFSQRRHSLIALFSFQRTLPTSRTARKRTFRDAGLYCSRSFPLRNSFGEIFLCRSRRRAKTGTGAKGCNMAWLGAGASRRRRFCRWGSAWLPLGGGKAALWNHVMHCEAGIWPETASERQGRRTCR